MRDGDDWVINGQKIWTSGAHWADCGILVTRSDPKAPKHKGLTFFFLDMKSPGHRDPPHQADLRARRTSTRSTSPTCASPTASVSARSAQGWGVAITTLMNERLTSGDLRGPDFEEIFALARAIELEDGPAIANAAVRERLADCYVQDPGRAAARASAP